MRHPRRVCSRNRRLHNPSVATPLPKRNRATTITTTTLITTTRTAIFSTHRPRSVKWRSSFERYRSYEFSIPFISFFSTTFQFIISFSIAQEQTHSSSVNRDVTGPEWSSRRGSNSQLSHTSIPANVWPHPNVAGMQQALIQSSFFLSRPHHRSDE